MDRLSGLLGSHVRSGYTCWGRIVSNGYPDRLRRPEHVAYVSREVVGEPGVTPAVLASRTGPHRAWPTGYAEARGIPVLAAPKGVRKAGVVAP